MAKESGLGLSVAVDDHAGAAKTISNDVTNLDFSTPRGVQDSTGVDSSANERILLLSDFSCTLNGIFNATADMGHDVFKRVSTTSVTRTITLVHSVQTLATECLLLDYNLARASTGELTYTVPAVLNSTTVPTWS